MKIYGLQKTTLLDYPGHVAATIFTGGCNMRCPFCHNMNLVEETDVSMYSQDEVLSFLKKRIGILDGVCITGGEPTLSHDLVDFIRLIKSLGYKIKLDTNGTNPSVLKSLIEDSLVDYIAMDIKSAPSAYDVACGIDNFDFSKVSESVSIIMSSNIPYEFRTTAVKQLLNSSIIEEIGLFLKGCNAYYLQAFVDSQYVPDHDFCAPSKEELLAYRKQLLKYIDHVEIRGVDL